MRKKKKRRRLKAKEREEEVEREVFPDPPRSKRFPARRAKEPRLKISMMRMKKKRKKKERRARERREKPLSKSLKSSRRVNSTPMPRLWIHVMLLRTPQMTPSTTNALV